MHIMPRRFLIFNLQFAVFLALSASAAIPSVEKILPDDTLFLVTTPDYTKMREVYRSSPQVQMWNDPAMKPFTDKLLSKVSENLIHPLEKDLGVDFSDYTNLPQGQITFAMTQNGWPAVEGAHPGMLFLLDTKDKNTQLMKNLADVRKKWIEAGKTLRTEKIRNIDFSVLAISDKDIPKTLRKYTGPDKDTDSDEARTNAPKNELYIGQFESLLIAGTAAKPIEKVLVHLTGGEMPSLGGLAVYDANRLALFRDAPLYGWVNIQSVIEALTHRQAQEDADTPDPFSMLSPTRILAATGLNKIKTFAFSLQTSPEGSMAQFFLTLPESSRQGLFAVLPGEPKDSSPPSFVPADAVKFQRWRVDGKKAWTTLQKVMSDISPQAKAGINFMLDTANAAAKEKDPDFDMDKNFFGNLGDDMMSYEKAPRGNTAAEINSAPSLFLLGSPNPDQVVSALKYLLVLMNQQSASPKEREFLGRKIYSVPLANAPAPGGNFSGVPGAKRSLNYTASGGYVAISTDASMVEEYLRSSDSQQKTLRETPGLTDAIAKVGGANSGLFGYENQMEKARVMFEALKSMSATNANTGSSMFPSFNTLPTAESLKDWADFSLLPPYDKVSKYFNFDVYTGSANSDGLILKMFSPTPPALRK
jgi:hypothetical protein